MNVIVFPSVVETKIVSNKEIKVISDYHRMVIMRMNTLGIYPMVSSERRPFFSSDLPNKNGVIISLLDKCVIPISDWMGEKVFGVVFYNFETTRRALLKICRWLKSILWGKGYYKPYVHNKLQEDGYLSPISKMFPDTVSSSTWTGTKVITNENEYIKDDYPKEFLDLEK